MQRKQPLRLQSASDGCCWALSLGNIHCISTAFDFTDDPYGKNLEKRRGVFHCVVYICEAEGQRCIAGYIHIRRSIIIIARSGR